MAKKTENKLSYCLKHQDRLTDTRCAACLKPICGECTVATDLGNFCSDECHQKRVTSNERVEILRKEEERERIPRLIRKLVGYALTALFFVALYILWTHLPHHLTDPIHKMIHDFFKSGKPSKG